MPKVTYIEADGAKHSIEIQSGWTLMQGATLNGITGIDGECGGSCACATCHVYVDEAFMARLGPPGADEQELLEFTASPRKFNSRLCCQIVVKASIDGIVVRLPETQS